MIRRARAFELLSALSAIALLVSMLALRWFGSVGLPGRTTGAAKLSAVSGWSALTTLRWLVLVTAVVALAAAAVPPHRRARSTRSITGLLVTALGTATAVLLAYRVLISLPDSQRIADQKLGAMIGLLLAFGIACFAYASLREERDAAEREASVRRPSRGSGPERSSRAQAGPGAAAAEPGPGAPASLPRASGEAARLPAPPGRAGPMPRRPGKPKRDGLA